MKKLLFLYFIALCSMVSATTYYVSTFGNDVNSGLSESSSFATISKVNSIFSSLLPGDKILFKRGDTFYGTILISKHGAENNKILIGAYGTGEMPIITGFTTINGWTNETGGIYSKVVSCQSQPKMLTINDQYYKLGRYPKAGWLTIDEVVPDVSITDADLPASPDWTGAQVVIRKNRWILDNHLILSHSNHTLNYANPTYYKPRVGWGYFIQNSLLTLTTFGDWCYNSSNSKLYLFFGTEDPTGYNVKLSSLDRCLYNNSYDYITIENITFQGANEKTIYGYSSPAYMTIQNCKLLFSGGDAVYMHYPDHCELLNTTINHTNSNAVNFGSGTDNIIRNNVISNSGNIAGAGNNDDGTCNAIISKGHNGFIENNRIINTGYLPVDFGGSNTIVRNNFINSCCFIKDDGAGIYIYNDVNPGKQVIDNIVLNCLGASSGTDTINATATSSANGLYADGYSSNVTFSGNTVYNATGAAIHLNPSTNITITGNTFYQCPKFLTIARWPLSGVISDINVNDNIYISTRSIFSAIQYTVAATVTLYNNDIIQEIQHLGYINNNYYYSNKECIMNVEVPAPYSLINAPYSFKRWSGTFGHDLNSVILPKFPEYIIDSLMDNRVTNSTFESNITGWSNSSGSSNPINWESNAGLDGGCLKATNVPASFAYNNNFISCLLTGVTDQSKNYILRLTGKSTQDEKTIGVLLESNTTPYLRSYYANYFTLGTSATEKEILIRNPLQNGNYLKLFGKDDNSSIYYDNIQLYEADVQISDPSENFRFEYAEGTPKNITLPQRMVSVKGAKYSNSLTLSPYTSIILMPDTSTISVFSHKSDRWDISIYPNPAQTFINISKLASSSEPQTVRIYNLMGELCLEQTLNQDSINRIQINLKQGLYIVQVRKGSLIMGVQKLNVIL